jgi:hypothetical protein
MRNDEGGFSIGMGLAAAMCLPSCAARAAEGPEARPAAPAPADIAKGPLMPDGKPFAMWDDRTQYKKVLHVATGHPDASDANPGTEAAPLKTIGRAAELLQPGEKVVIRSGIYRERVAPARGGSGPDAMIAYEAAAGERVVLRGSEVWSPAAARFRPSDVHKIHEKAPKDVTIWMGDLPVETFQGYNPFAINNTSSVLMAYGHTWTPEEMKRFLLKRGMLFAGGRPIRQVSDPRDLAKEDGCFWADRDGLALHLRLPDDADPRQAELEIAVREQIFAPRVRELGYVRVSGLVLEHAANPIPLTTLQHGALSANSGHHWIVEDCAIRHANGVGADVGIQKERVPEPRARGGHLIRRNAFTHHGVAGLCGMGGPNDTLVEDNRFEHIGGLKIERMFECAAVKFHLCERVLIRRNVFRRLVHACGIWLDLRCGWNRISNNVFADIDSIFGGVHVECSHEPHWIDGNVFWDMKSWRADQHPPESPARGGHGVFADTCDQVTIAHNLFGPSVSYAAACHFKQPARDVYGRVGLNRRHRIVGNVFADCAKRILFGRADENASDGNLFDKSGDPASLCLYRPEPQAVLNLAAWRDYFGWDRKSIQTRLEAKFDVEAGELRWEMETKGLPGGLLTDSPRFEDPAYAVPGPFSREAWQEALTAGRGRQAFPVGFSGGKAPR